MTEHGGQPIREAVAYFNDPDKLFAAVSDLEGAGFDRSYLSVLARESFLEGELGDGRRSTHEVEDDPKAQRTAVIADTDIRQVRTLATSMAGVVAAFAASGITVMTGGGALAALAAAAAGGMTAGVFAGIGRRAGQEEQEFLRDQIERGGIILWVKTPDEAHEQRALEVLERHGAMDAHVRDMPTPAEVAQNY